MGGAISLNAPRPSLLCLLQTSTLRRGSGEERRKWGRGLFAHWLSQEFLSPSLPCLPCLPYLPACLCRPRARNYALGKVQFWRLETWGAPGDDT